MSPFVSKFALEGPRFTQALPGTRVAWTGPARPAPYPGADTYAQLFQSTWENPFPEVAVETIDYLCAKTEAIPFLIAVTAEP